MKYQFLKRYEFLFDADSETVIKLLISGTTKYQLRERFRLFEKDCIYSMIWKNRIFFYHGKPIRSFISPVFVAKITEDEKTHLVGFWTLSLSNSILFVCSWFFLLSIAAIPLLRDVEVSLPLLYAVIALFFLFEAGLIKLGFFLERKRMQRVMEHITAAQKL